MVHCPCAKPGCAEVGLDMANIGKFIYEFLVARTSCL